MLGRGSINHNSRKFKAENINIDRTPYNISYCDEPIKKVYHQLFHEALERYNAKQKRNDRRIENYYEKIRTGKQEKLFHEVIFQIGNVENMSSLSEDGDLAKKILDEFMKSFQSRNPNLHVFSAHLHMDEATPHLHIDFVPFTTGSKRGLDTRVSLKQALTTQGFTGGSRGDTEWKQWVESEKEQLSKVMERHDVQWEKLGTQKEHLSVLNFKKEERAKEVEVLEKALAPLKKKQIDIQAVDSIEAKPLPLSSKVTLSQEDYATLSMAAKKLVVQEKKERKLKQLLKIAEKTIAELKAKIVALSQKINQLSSVKNQLDKGELQLDNINLKKENTFLKSIIEKNGLTHLLKKTRKERSRDTHY
ncbi:MAG: recombinase [Clostridiales bacterium]|nr:recombinase [Clostridiales bacterium]